MTVGRFLCGIAALIYDAEAKKYLLLQRSAQKDVGAGQWECPTGRVDQGEGFEDALLREVEEELRVTALPQFIIGTTHFYRGSTRPENELVGIIYECSIPDPRAVKIGEEHAEAKWLNVEEIDNFLPANHWLRWVIQRAELIRNNLPADLKEHFRNEGFEVGGRNLYR